jgi:hypothetical protein
MVVEKFEEESAALPMLLKPSLPFALAISAETSLQE